MSTGAAAGGPVRLAGQVRIVAGEAFGDGIQGSLLFDAEHGISSR